MRVRLPIALPLLAIAVTLGVGGGCASERSFGVSVKNATDRPLTVGFVTTGTPSADWASPEDFAMAPPSRQPTTWGRVIEPGMTASARISGRFDPGAAAYLRIYSGAHTLDDLLAISRGRDRVDLILEPGDRNRFIVKDVDGKLSAHLVPP